jgi:hypothetical protein
MTIWQSRREEQMKACSAIIQAKQRHRVVIVLLVLLTLGISHKAYTQAVCSDEEVQVTGNDFIVLPTVSLTKPEPVATDEQCKITFSTEAATSESSPQLLELGYAFFFDPNQLPPPAICTSLDGPILTRVADGFDETHTFISVVENTPSPHGPLVMAPCVKSAFGGQLRLRRHCLIVECLAR